MLAATPTDNTALVAAAQGLTPEIAGDRTVALIAQVNRFAKATGRPIYVLTPGPVPREIALMAMMLLQARLISAVAIDPSVAAELRTVTSKLADPVPYVTQNIEAITRVLALYGDMQGLPAAKAGITDRLAAKPGLGALGAFAILGVAAILGFGILRYARTVGHLQP